MFAFGLIGGTVLAVLAAVRPRPLYFWLATGGLALAVVGASGPSTPAPPQLAPLIGAVGITLAVFGGGPAATTALRLAMGGSAVPGLHGGILVSDPSAPTQPGLAPARREVLRGGLTIGVLERLAAAGTIVAGFPEGLAIVVAVKGVGRFTELEAPEARERFIIGTLASLIWACAAGLAVHLAVR
ncbi:hypothetical protein GE115_17150 [Agromyces sp. CFH 90414]|uniref:Uncharacterized protein n=1 Tax=Agromyces agglutinans TaxID=2662258 RepID=A0A6I2FLS1_9MICO|nr:hypothetical protein [Agromyces agglutinans]